MDPTDVENTRQAFGLVEPLAHCPWNRMLLQDKLENVFSQDSMEDHSVKYKCSPENFRGHFLRRPFQALSDIQIKHDGLKSANLYLKQSSGRILLECCDAIAGLIELRSATSPNVFFLETHASSLELECTFESVLDIDQVPDFLGTGIGQRFKMPGKDTLLGLFKCPEAILKVRWASHVVSYELDEDSDSDSDVSQMIEEVLQEEHDDSSDLRTVLMQPQKIKRHCSKLN